jgi:hypothetical protein
MMSEELRTQRSGFTNSRMVKVEAPEDADAFRSLQQILESRRVTGHGPGERTLCRIIADR